MEENRRSLIKDLVLNSIADDYEDFRIILDEVTHWGSQRGVQLTRNEIETALRDLLSAGHAQAYELSTLPPHSTPVVVAAERIRASYYYLTPAGRDILRNLVELGFELE